MMESLLDHLRNLNPALLYLVLGVVSFIENIFPPFPSDVIVVFIGSLIGLGTIAYVPSLLSATAGSAAGFAVMFMLGSWFGKSIIEKGKARFLPLDGVHKVETWFKRYGYLVIVINRFMSGTRAVISFAAGMSELALGRSTLFASLSALVWNGLLLFGGMQLGANWRIILDYADILGYCATGILVLIGAWYGIRYLRNNKKGNTDKS